MNAPVSRSTVLRAAFLGYVPTLAILFSVFGLVLLLQLLGVEARRTIVTGVWLLVSLKCAQWCLQTRDKYLSRPTSPAQDELGALWTALLIYVTASLAALSLGLVFLNVLEILYP